MIRRLYVYKLASLAAIFSLLLPAVAPPLVHATDVTPRYGGVIPGVERQITTYTGNDYDPSLSGNIIVYTQTGLIDDDIRYYDLANSLDHPVSTGWGTQALSDVSNGVIAYSDLFGTYNKVMIFRVDTGITTEIAPLERPVHAINPAIDGALVAWEESLSIHALDLASGVERQVSYTTGVDRNPAVAGNVIVYQRHTSAQGDIYAYDWATGLTRTIEDDPGIDARNPDTNGLAVVYDGKDSADAKDLYLFDLVTGETKRLILPGNQENPNISGDYVSFEEYVDGQYSVRLWHVPTGTVFDIDTTLVHQYLNNIEGNRVVYTGVAANYYPEDIYMYTFGTPTYTITAAAGPGGTITPSGEVTVSIGEDQGFTITPNPGYHILDVTVDGLS